MYNHSKSSLVSFELEYQARQESAALRQKYELDIIERQITAAQINRNNRLKSSKRSELKRLFWVFVGGFILGVFFSVISYFGLKKANFFESIELGKTNPHPTVGKPIPIDSNPVRETHFSGQNPPEMLVQPATSSKNVVPNLILENKPLQNNLAKSQATTQVIVDKKDGRKIIEETFSVVSILSKEAILIKKNNELNAQTISIGQMLSKTEQLKQIFTDTKTIVTTNKTITLE